MQAGQFWTADFNAGQQLTAVDHQAVSAGGRLFASAICASSASPASRLIELPQQRSGGHIIGIIHADSGDTAGNL